MAYFYSENEVRTPFRSKTPYDALPALDYWKNHRSNLLMLRFFWKAAGTLERRSIDREIQICERKMKRWERHINWNAADAARIAEQQDRDWKNG
jgi:hypothetical protein